MNRLLNFAALGLTGMLGLATVGCGNPNQPTPDDPEAGINLREVGQMYRTYQLAKSKPPTSQKEALSVPSDSGMGSIAVENGDVVVNWGAKLPDLNEGPSDVDTPEVLAYEKQVPTEGGYVLMLNRQIKKMTADEFKAAPQAGQ